MGHCASYDTVEMIDTALAREILAKSEIDGVAIPSNITPDSFIQFAADNNAINEETLDGKQTTHATTLDVYQKGHFGTAPVRRVYADHSQRKRSLTSEIIGQTIADFGAFGKRPDIPNIVHVNPNNKQWFDADNIGQIALILLGHLSGYFLSPYIKLRQTWKLLLSRLCLAGVVSIHY